MTAENKQREIKPCPHCGGHVRFDGRDFLCNSCGTETRFPVEGDEAVERFNRRH